MRRLSTGQLERISEIAGNISVAWFSAGIISPLFFRPNNILDLMATFGISAIMTIMFFVVSIELVKEVKI